MANNVMKKTEIPPDRFEQLLHRLKYHAKALAEDETNPCPELKRLVVAPDVKERELDEARKKQQAKKQQPAQTQQQNDITEHDR